MFQDEVCTDDGERLELEELGFAGCELINISLQGAHIYAFDFAALLGGCVICGL